jgi:hypothetical protein
MAPTAAPPARDDCYWMIRSLLSTQGQSTGTTAAGCGFVRTPVPAVEETLAFALMCVVKFFPVDTDTCV